YLYGLFLYFRYGEGLLPFFTDLPRLGPFFIFRAHLPFRFLTTRNILTAFHKHSIVAIFKTSFSFFRPYHLRKLLAFFIFNRVYRGFLFPRFFTTLFNTGPHHPTPQ